MLGHHSCKLLWFGVELVSGQHLAQVREAGGAQHVFVQDRSVVAALTEERRGSAVQAERQGRLSVRHKTTERLERVEEVVSPREEVHVVVGTWERGRVETPSGTTLQHAALVALVLQHYRDAGQGHRHDSAEVKQRFKWRRILQWRRWEKRGGREGEEVEGVSYKSLMQEI